MHGFGLWEKKNATRKEEKKLHRKSLSFESDLTRNHLAPPPSCCDGLFINPYTTTQPGWLIAVMPLQLRKTNTEADRLCSERLNMGKTLERLRMGKESFSFFQVISNFFVYVHCEEVC